MAEGTNTYKGLAVPLQGESEITQLHAATDIVTLTANSSITGDFFICQTSAGTELFQIQNDGRTRINSTADGQNALDVYFTLTASNANQCYGQTIYFESGGFASAGGRHAVLNLWYAYDGGGGAAHSYINFAAPGASTHPLTLMTILNADVDDSLFVTCVAAAADHGLRIYVDNVVYYIMLSNSTAA